MGHTRSGESVLRRLLQRPARILAANYYNITGTGSNGIKVGLDHAVADGVDVVNYSGAVGGYECNTTADISLINESIQAAANAGALDTSDTSIAYDTSGIAGYSNTGPVPVRTFVGLSTTMAGVGLTAPGGYSLLDYDLRNKLQLRGAAVNGRCLEMHIYGYNVPPGGRVVYTSDFFHSGTPD